MSVSKRLRFEIFRRDNHACRYCGTPASVAPLTIDHVIPSTLGGTDDPSNLVAACDDCNSGKSATSPDAELVAEVADDALRWARAQHAAAEDMLADLAKRDASRAEFKAAWDQWQGRAGEPMPLPAQWPESVDRFLAVGLPMPVLLDCLNKAMRNMRIRDPFRYTCGIAWKKVGELQQVATRSLAPQTAERINVSSPYKDAIGMLMGQLPTLELLAEPEYAGFLVEGFDASGVDDEDEDGNPIDYSSWDDQLKAVVQLLNVALRQVRLEPLARDLVEIVLRGNLDQLLEQAAQQLRDEGDTPLLRYAVFHRALLLAVRASLRDNPWGEF